MNSQLKSFHFTFIAPVEGLSFKPKYRGNIIHHLIFVFVIFSITLPAVIKDQFTVLIIKFVIEDFTDSDSSSSWKSFRSIISRQEN